MVRKKNGQGIVGRMYNKTCDSIGLGRMYHRHPCVEVSLIRIYVETSSISRRSPWDALTSFFSPLTMMSQTSIQNVSTIQVCRNKVLKLIRVIQLWERYYDSVIVSGETQNFWGDKCKTLPWYRNQESSSDMEFGRILRVRAAIMAKCFTQVIHRFDVRHK